MSVTAPHPFRPSQRPANVRRFTLPSLEWGGGSLFIRLGRLEAYARPMRPAAWFVLREPGSVEVSAGRYCVTVAWGRVQPAME